MKRTGLSISKAIAKPTVKALPALVYRANTRAPLLKAGGWLTRNHSCKSWGWVAALSGRWNMGWVARQGGACHITTWKGEESGQAVNRDKVFQYWFDTTFHPSLTWLAAW